jgi:hypothetical protein
MPPLSGEKQRLDSSVSTSPSRRPAGIASLVKNPLVIIAAAIVIALTGAGLAVFSADHQAPSTTSTVIERVFDISLTVTPTVTRPGAVRSAATVDVRTLPSEEAQILGTLRRGQELDIAGRSADGAWIAISYPPGSGQHGWITASAVDRADQIRAVPTVTPAPFRSGQAANPAVLQTPETQASRQATPTVTAPLPDLVVSAVDLLGDGRLEVTVRNQGSAGVNGQPIEVALAGANGQILRLAGTEVRNLGPGQSVNIIIPYVITQSMGIRILVDPNGRIEESVRRNDIFEAMVQPPSVPALPTTATAAPSGSAVAGPTQRPPTVTPTVTPTPVTTPPTTATKSPTSAPSATQTITPTPAATSTAAVAVTPTPTQAIQQQSATPGPFSSPPPTTSAPQEGSNGDR